MKDNNTLTNRQKKALETKKALFEATLKLILERGFENVSIDEITSMAGTSKGSFYTYFRSKDQVIVEYYKQIDNVYLNVYQRLENNLKSSETLIQVLKAGLTYSEKLGNEVMRIVFINQFGKTEDIPYLMDSNRNIYKIVRETIEEGQINGEFREDLPVKEMMAMILNFYAGNFFEWSLMNNDNFADKAEKFLRTFIEGTFKH
ncbi:TetR/AcrR family transcriptional regulator [Alteribacillus sp. JSM 102045]|uniref:TetR/AcrR family transcriptional regulator n=1 Tax=Alteribacillus sp. JSM 102045 TaxID=1562101 RepID=UPI0035BEE836